MALILGHRIDTGSIAQIMSGAWTNEPYVGLMPGETAVWTIALAIAEAIRDGTNTAKSNDDKEFHFQRWIGDCIKGAGYQVKDPGRNTYPDFEIASIQESYEVKGITFGSRETDFDCNSTMVTGQHDGIPVLYIFGRYEPGDNPAVVDAVIAHGGFLNATQPVTAKNRSLRVLGSYGDVLLRDRKMFVAPTPYGLVHGLDNRTTVIVPPHWQTPPSSFVSTGTLQRAEAPEILVGYEADLVSDTLKGRFVPNPNAGATHDFSTWQVGPDEGEVMMR